MLRFPLLLLFPVLLVAQEITILSPAGGEVLKCDSTYMARWTYTAKAGGNIFQVNIQPKKASSSLFLAQKTFTTGAPGADSLSFTIMPFNQSMDSCQILVFDKSSPQNFGTSGYFSVIQERPDPYEPNQDTAHAYRISMNDSLGSALMGPWYDYDYFKTNLSAGDHIDFIVRKQAALYRLYYVAIGPDGKTITSGTWTATDANSIRHKYSLIAYQSGSYYLALDASSFTGHYSVALKPHSGNITLVPPTGITTYSAESTYVFSFTGSNFFSAPQLFAKSDPGSPVSLYLGSFSTTNTLSCKMPLTNSTTPITFVLFEPNGGSAALSDTSATFSLTTLKPDPYEPNDDTANAFEIIPGDSLANAILGTTFSTKSDTDYYRFSGTAGNTYELRISAVAGSGTTPFAYFQVISPNGTPLGAEMLYSGPGSKRLGTPVSGKYILKIYSLPWASSRYNLVFNSVEAGEYIFSAPLSGDVWPCDTFNNIRWTSQNVGATVGIEMCLDGNYWYPLTGAGQQNTGISSPFFHPIKATNPNVRLRIYDCSGTGLVATDTSAPFTLKVDRPDIYEPNNDSLSPWLLHSGDSLSEGCIHYPSGLTALDSDWFAFNALAGDTVKFPVELLPHASGFYVYLYPPATSSPLTYYISSGLGSMTPLVAPKSGKYLLRIAGSSFASCGRYTLQFYNSSGRTADCSLAVISPKTGDAFSAGSIQTITWINFGQIPLIKILLLNGSQYSLIVDSLPNTKSYSWTIPLVKDTGALYKIKIQSSGGSGVLSQNISPSFSITGASSDPYEPNNSTATAFLITDTDVLLTGADIPLVFAGDSQDVDYFCFNGLANYTVNIQTYAPAGSHKMAGSLTLFNLDGVTALRTNSNSVDRLHNKTTIELLGPVFFCTPWKHTGKLGKLRLYILAIRFFRRRGFDCGANHRTGPVWMRPKSF